MNDLTVRKAPLPWWLGGLILGLIMVLAVGLKKPLGVSTQFVVVESLGLHRIAPEYADNHPVLKTEKYTKLGYGFWLDVGLVAGALIAAVASRRWQFRATTVWWRASYGPGTGSRLLTGFIGGFFILLGARLAHGCTSGQFASGWAQLSVSAVPFTVTMFAAGIIVARLVYPKPPTIER
jgi:uncharacterized membrane protein YedE/YeeE